ncbi:MAG: tyrosine--tRNA ligase [Patescibacteria group bacterium]
MKTDSNSAKDKINLIIRNCEEVLIKEDLEALITSGTPLRHYIGFEISGKVHLGTGLMSMGKIADFLTAGVDCTIFLADFHSYLNNKLGGDWNNIRLATEEYFKEGLIASLKCFGVDDNQVKFVTGKELYTDNLVHWETFMEAGKHITLSRNLRSISIMGKSQGTDVDMATLFYPPLQVADIFTLGVNLAHAGIDQRKAHVIARQVANKLTINPLKDSRGKIVAPVAIHQNTIAGLTAPSKDIGQKEADLAAIELKMSKSKPNSAVFVHDSPEEIENKIKGAYCPPEELAFNPIINWVENLVFWGEKEGEFVVDRPTKFGGSKTYQSVEKLKKDYQSGELHPMDLKTAVASWLIKKLAPARNHFSSGRPKRGLELINQLLPKT